MFLDDLENLFDKFLVGLREPGNSDPGADKVSGPVHPPAKERKDLQGQKAGFMSPVFKKLPSFRRIAGFIQQFHRVSAKPGKQWQIVCPHQDVHRINLQHSDSSGSGQKVPTG